MPDFRLAEPSDLPSIMHIIRQAQEFLRANNVDQWQDGYPDAAAIQRDIMSKISYVATANGNVAATAAISFGGEETYNIIRGEWKSNGQYAVVHRVAVDSKYRGSGLASEILRYAESLCHERGVHSIKIDTHENNIIMQSLLTKNGYEYCGIISLNYGTDRLAYEKLLDFPLKNL